MFGYLLRSFVLVLRFPSLQFRSFQEVEPSTLPPTTSPSRSDCHSCLSPRPHHPHHFCFRDVRFKSGDRTLLYAPAHVGPYRKALSPDLKRSLVRSLSPSILPVVFGRFSSRSLFSRYLSSFRTTTWTRLSADIIPVVPLAPTLHCCSPWVFSSLRRFCST